jgi:aerobic-type carbon monoxide dehydrogenase small subunit (CoxS/CutS family)
VCFTLNGKPTTVAAPPFASLADTLRERLRLTGTKIGCEAGDCGACTVILDGAQVCACLVATGQANGARIDTVEGAGPSGITERLRTAFLAHGAPGSSRHAHGRRSAGASRVTAAPT